MAEKKKVFFIEGNYDPRLSKQISVESALDFFSKVSSVEIYRSRATHPDELYRHLKTVSYKKNALYNIVYISSHGRRGSISLDDSKESAIITLEDIANNCEGFLEGKLIHFGSCSTLHVSETRLQGFLHRTGAIAISGYTKQTTFLEGTFLDILLFERYRYTDSIKILERQLKKEYAGLIEKLGFKLFLS